MKRILKRIALTGLVFIGGCGLVIGIVGGPRRHFDRLVKTADHAAIARAAITTILQAETNQLYSDTSSYALKLTNLPPVIFGMRPSYVNVESDNMHIEFHGGFDHFGFDVQKHEREWEMSWYTEHGHHRILAIPIVEAKEANQVPENTARKLADPQH